MSDDLVPEEEGQKYDQILGMLRSSSQRHVPITHGEQTQIIARVRERLAHATSASPLPEAGVFAPRRQFTPSISTRHARKSTQLVANLLAALVVIGLILGSWVLFRAHPSSHGTPVSTPVSGSGPAAQTQADGLEASMHVLIGGPYFLSELLPVDVSFTNHTQKPVGLGGSVRITNNSIANPCFPPTLLVQVTKGDNPSYTFPKLDVGCLQPYFMNEVKPGQTITIHQYVPLTKSGEVTLTRGMLLPDHRTDPINGRWPTVHVQVQVSPQIPQNRALSLHNQKGQVMIEMPASAKTHLLYMQTISCENYFDSSGARWMPLLTNVLHEPTCPAPHPHWEYIVSAPGYAIVAGSQPS